MNWILYALPGVPLLVAITLYIINELRSEKIDASIHYVERVRGLKYITSCGKELDLDSKNIANFIPKVTCKECLEKIK